MRTDRALTTPGGLARQMATLWERQAADWPMLAAGITGLRQSQTRSFNVGGSHVIAQCNPCRIRSASAKTDPSSIAARPCFLCPDNLPDAQHGITYHDNWLILCNPAPIFEPHFTIASIAHEPQCAGPAIGTMFDLVRDLEGAYTVFYNGPRCGASAPDHPHVQATPAGAMPFETELAAELCSPHDRGETRWLEWIRTGPVRVGTSRASRRPVVVLISSEKKTLINTLEEVIEALAAEPLAVTNITPKRRVSEKACEENKRQHLCHGQIRPAAYEPMFNLFATFVEDRWIAWLFPRAAHRPAVYGDGPDDYLISPGAVDLAGVVIVPRCPDFDRLDAPAIQLILGEVLLSPGAFARLRDRLAAARK